MRSEVAIGERVKPVSTAVLALSTTALIYIPGAFIGYALLRWEPFHSLEMTFPHQFADVIDLIYGGILDQVETWPAWVVFLGGLGVLLGVLQADRLGDAVARRINDRTRSGSRGCVRSGRCSPWDRSSRSSRCRCRLR